MMKLVNATNPAKVPAELFETAFDAVTAFFDTPDNPFREMYASLDWGESEELVRELGPDATPERETPSNLDVTKKKREAAVKAALDEIRKDCAAAQTSAAALCAATPLEADSSAPLPGVEGTCVAAGRLSANLEALYARAFELRARFMLGQALGEDQIEELEREETEATAPAQANASEEMQEIVRSRLFGLDETPDLGRLFRTLVDLTVTEQDSQKLAEAAGSTGAHFLFLRLNPAADLTTPDPEARDDHTRWSLVKMTVERAASGALTITQFLPATRAEALLTLGGCAGDSGFEDRLSQIDGLQVLGGRDGAGAPVYELVATDLRAASQALEARADALGSMAAVVLNSANQVSTSDLAPDGVQSEIDPINLKSDGLSVVNFQSARNISRQLGVAKFVSGQPCGQTFLDADDLTTGRVPYIGIVARGEDGAARQVWFPLSRKITRYDRAAGLNFQIDPLIDNIYKTVAPGFTRMRALAQMTVDRTVGRGQRLGASVAETDTQTVVIPDSELTYFGDPLGVETGLEERTVQLLPKCDLNISRAHSLPRGRPEPAVPENGTADRPLPPRFGMPLRMAYASSFIGGVTLSWENVVRALEQRPKLAVPAANTEALSAQDPTGHGRRYLRSEAVAPVNVMMPFAEARKEVNSYRGSGAPEFMPDTTSHITLRSRGGGETPSAVTRVVLPPVLNLDFAEQHGVFDVQPPAVFPTIRRNVRTEAVDNVPVWPGKPEKRGLVRRPADGMKDVDMEAAWGGAPILERTEEVVSDRPVVTGARINSGNGWRQAVEQWAREGRDPASRPLTPVGDGVFRRSSSNTRSIPYYPDPMASDLVIRVRLESENPLEEAMGEDRVAFVSSFDAQIYPKSFPVAINTRTGDRLSVKKRDRRGLTSGVTCVQVDVTVPPGITAAVDIWALPSRQKLAFWSELVDTAATVCSDTGALPQTGGCGFLGRCSPSQQQLESMAALVHHTLQRRPIPDVAQMTTIVARHAVAKPVRAPAPAPGAFLLRRAPEPPQAPLSPGGIPPLGPDVVAQPADIPDAWFQSADQDPMNAAYLQTEADLGHFLNVHLPSTGAVEILTRAVAPNGGPIDTPELARSLKAQVAGDFTANPSDPDDTRILTSSKTHGFFLTPQKLPVLPSSDALWARLTNLPDQIDGKADGFLSLHALFSQRPAAGIEAEIAPLFADTKARRVFLKFRAMSRHATAFLTRPRLTTSGAYVPASQSLGETPAQSRETDWYGPFWLPASDRPAVPKPFVEARDKIDTRNVPTGSNAARVRRMSVVRLWLERPWFSSGEDEKFGIVIWPRLAKNVPFYRSLNILPKGPSARSRVPRPSLGDTRLSARDLKHKDTMVLNTFEKRLLPRVAEFLTSWGSDPVESFHPLSPTDWVVPPPMFADFSQEITGELSPGRSDASFVPDVRLPVPKGALGDDGVTAPLPPDESDYLNVDLLAYTPRFDPFQQRWYVDLLLDPGTLTAPFLRLGICRFQEHAPRDLQLSLPGAPFEFQLQTAREAEVSRVPASNGDARIEVTVTGPASPEPVLDAPLDDAGVATRMHVHLIGRNIATGTTEVTLQHRVAPTTGTSADPLVKEWSCTFEVPQALADPETMQLQVHIEEQAFRPSAKSDPASGAGGGSPQQRDRTADDDTAATGASPNRTWVPGSRFLCMLEVP
ncbi:MAG: hypothetical protein V2I76_06285 [Roseobacter sp.]|nr:hypothetical protein [Roseobacter sp.]